MYIRNRKGPKIEPCGTPQQNENQSDEQPLIHINLVPFLRCEESQLFAVHFT